MITAIVISAILAFDAFFLAALSTVDAIEEDFFLPQNGQNSLSSGNFLSHDVQQLVVGSTLIDSPQNGQKSLSSGMSLLHF